MWNFVIGLALNVISLLFFSKPKQPEAAKPGEFDIPRVEEGTELGKPYGTVWIKSPHVHWWGDPRTKKIKD